MPVWGWILIAVAAIVVLLVLGVSMLSRRRTNRLRGNFGPEYDRAIDESSSKRDAEAELAERERRREQLDIRPLSAEQRERFTERWQRTQVDFVDSPSTAVSQADALIIDVMRERGYPMDDFDQRAADISVDHPEVVGRYREGHGISLRAARGEASTEDLRQAMQHYRELFSELVEPAADEPMRDGRAELDGSRTERDRARAEDTAGRKTG
jgi:hypothetical protein